MVHCLFNGLRIKKILRHTVQVQVLNLILILGYLIYVLPAEKKKNLYGINNWIFAQFGRQM